MLNSVFIQENEVGEAINEFVEYWDWFNIRILLPNVVLLIGPNKWLVKFDNKIYGLYKEKELADVLFYLKNIKKPIEQLRKRIK